MARPRLPTEVQELKGAFRKDPQRKRPVGAKSTAPLGAPPVHLKPDERECWLEAVHAAPGGVLTAADRWVLEVAARLMAKFRADWLTGAEFGVLSQALGKLGWTPSDRSKVQAPDAEAPPNEFAEFMQ